MHQASVFKDALVGGEKILLPKEKKPLQLLCCKSVLFIAEQGLNLEVTVLAFSLHIPLFYSTAAPGFVCM